MTPMIMFGAFGGLRTSEIERLTWEDVRLDVKQLYVSKGKTKNTERWVVLTPPLLEWVEKMMKAGASELVLRGIGLWDRSRAKRRLYNRAGITRKPNALRHSCGSHHLVHHSPQMTFKTYRKAVHKVQAAAYSGVKKKTTGRQGMPRWP